MSDITNILGFAPSQFTDESKYCALLPPLLFPHPSSSCVIENRDVQTEKTSPVSRKQHLPVFKHSQELRVHIASFLPFLISTVSVEEMVNEEIETCVANIRDELLKVSEEEKNYQKISIWF